MKQDNKDKRRARAAVAVSIIALVLALCGAGFGALSLANNIDSSKKITALQKEISGLKEEISRLKNTIPNVISEKTKLKIASSSWSGWQESKGKTEEKINYYDLELNKKYVVRTVKTSHLEGDKWVEGTKEMFSFVINEINEDSIAIHTYQVFSDKETGVNLSSDKKDFVVKFGETLKLTTPTMDAGDIYKLTLEDR